MTIFRALKFLFAAVAVAMAALPAVASAASDPPQPAECRKPEYPRRASRDGEDGVTWIAFHVRADGTVERSIILSSSGSADLDKAVAHALSKCVFKPAVQDGKAIESWSPVAYAWSMDDDPGMARAKHDAAIAAVKGDVAARYRLSRLLMWNATTDADRDHALAVLRSAADLGHAPAQFDLGRHYEKGDRIKADIEEALRWYQKAAAQGDVLAIQRIQAGFLPN